MDEYEYVVTYVPSGCTNYTLGQKSMKVVPEPPPTTIMIESTGACNGTMLALVDE